MNDDGEFENNDVDPGFSTDELKIDAVVDGVSMKSMKSIGKSMKNKNNDAMNYDNDRKNGLFNPKNI